MTNCREIEIRVTIIVKVSDRNSRRHRLKGLPTLRGNNLAQAGFLGDIREAEPGQGGEYVGSCIDALASSSR